MGALSLDDLAARLASRDDRSRTEASLQSDVRTLLLSGGLDLADHDLLVPELEQPVAGGRIDVEVGFTVIETKRDLRKAGVREQAEPQLARYLLERSRLTGQRYVGILTDGVDWSLHLLRPDGSLREVSAFRLQPGDADVAALTVWLEGATATAEAIAPSAQEIERRLGAGSPAHDLERAQLDALWEQARALPEVQVKRELWARLLTAALGTKFEDDDALFIEHTYLVVTAELIGHAVIGFDIADPSHAPAALLAGQLFAGAQVGGVVEEDFFDWVVDVPDGPGFVSTLARRLARFAWQDVDHDVLKHLYESVIAAEQRHKLGEYYTPDWMAERIVAETIDDPLNQRVLDPSCGSGTFLFHAVRRYVEAAEAAGQSPAQAALNATSAVAGVDLHPVAVTLARVTFLLALGTERLTHPDRGFLSVPVYLGDSLLWRQDSTLFARGGVTVHTSDQAELFARELHFPGRVLADAGRFDQLVGALADRAVRRTPGSKVPDIAPLLNQFAVGPDDQQALKDTFAALCVLYDEGRDHIWSYYARNVARPFWLSREENRVDRLVGNPPWLAFRFMPEEMQERFRERSRERNLWTGRQVATQQDLSGYFVARCVELYLRQGGRFAFVMPAAVLDRGQWAGFRAGDWSGPSSQVHVAFDEPWDMADVKPHPFPVPNSVVFGSHARAAAGLAGARTRWAGRLPAKNVPWPVAASALATTSHEDGASGAVSPYKQRFFNGATIYPRVLAMVEDAPAGPLGAGAGRRSVRSQRSNQEDARWKSQPTLTGTVEAGFVARVYLGASLLPFRLLAPAEAVIPAVGGRLLEGSSPKLDAYPGLAAWWREAERLWDANKGKTTMTLAEQFDYQSKLTKQFPTAPHRVLFPKSGMTLAAARLTDPQGVVENTAYWAACASESEARYLTAIVNSDALLDRIKHLQSRGQFGRRHFDKVLFAVPFPIFDPAEETHRRLVSLAERGEQLAAEVELGDVGFQRARALVRDALAADGLVEELNDAVEALLA